MELYELLIEDRTALIDRWRDKVRANLAPKSLPEAYVIDSLPRFLDELVEALRVDGTQAPTDFSLPSQSLVASEHGTQRLKLGFDVGAVVREYGLLADAILERAAEREIAITATEASIFCKCMNSAAAEAAEEYSTARDREAQAHTAKRLAFLAHEIRNALGIARFAASFLNRKPSTGFDRHLQMLNRGLTRLTDLVDNALLNLRLKPGPTLRRFSLNLTGLLQEVAVDSAFNAGSKDVQLKLISEPNLSLHADRRLLRSTLISLVRNAVKFTKKGGRVLLRARAAEGRVLVDVEDECGGLEEGQVEKMFDPFVQLGADESGFARCLASAKQAAEAHGGVIRVVSVPGRGCVFSLDLPSAHP
jgi:signal transduction histidine kinase